MAQTNKELSLEQVTRILKARMARSAFLHLSSMDVRTGTALEVAGLTARTGEETFDNNLVQIILDLTHPRRVTTVVGPALFYRDADNEKQQFALEMKALLFSPDARLRKAALLHFVTIGDSQPLSSLTRKTRKAIDELEHECLGAEPGIWQPAALRLHDAIEADLLCQIAGARQSIKERYEEGLRFYIPRLLKPTLDGLEALELPFPKPSEQQDQIVTEIDSIANRAESLRAACDQYLETIGTLPLRGATSFPEMIGIWRKRRAESSEVWMELWDWAQTGSPIKKFYACTYFFSSPTRLDDRSKSAISDALCEIFQTTNDDEKASQSPSAALWFWKVFEELAQHYMRYLETIAPGGQGEPMAISAWWLAGRLAEVLCESVAAVSHLRQVALEPAAQSSQLAWRFANSRIVQSPASLATHWSLWQIAMLAAIDSNSAIALAKVLDEAHSEQLQSLVTKRLMFWSPITTNRESKSAFLFEAALQDCVTHWTRVFGTNERQEFLREIERLYTELENPQIFVDKFKDIANSSDVDQLVITNAAKLLSLRDALPLDPVWEQLTDSKWRAAAFRKLSPIALEMLFFALASSLHRGGDKWFASLPHIYAQACEENRGDEKRIELLFIFVVISSIHSYSVSALERLLRGDMRSDLLALAKEWRAQLQNLSREVSPWVAARIRAVIAAISASL